MRLGIKGKQVLGVTLDRRRHRGRAEPDASGAPGAGQPRREPGPRRAAGERHLSPRARGGGRRRRSVRRRCTRSGPAVDPRSRASTRTTSRLPPSSMRRAWRSRTPTRRRRAAGCRSADDLGELLDATVRSTSCSAIYRDQGRNLEFRQPLLLGDRPSSARFAIGVSTLLIRRRPERSLRTGRRHGAAGARRGGVRCDACSRSCCCGRFT